jgi:hypothetical protein
VVVMTEAMALYGATLLLVYLMGMLVERRS